MIRRRDVIFGRNEGKLTCMTPLSRRMSAWTTLAVELPELTKVPFALVVKLKFWPPVEVTVPVPN